MNYNYETIVLNKPKNHFKHILGKALRDEKVVFMPKPDRYRRLGKTTMITNAFYMKENAFIVVSTRQRACMYAQYVPQERVLTVRDIKHMKGLNVGCFIFDEISFQEYIEVRDSLYLFTNKMTGIVSIYGDYEVL